VEGFPAMMNAEQFIVDHHEADVITQSFGAAEETFGSPQSLLNLRHAFISAAANGVTVLASTGDFGTANPGKTPLKHPKTIPFPTVGWPASDPLVTGVGGTYLCTDPSTGTGVDTADPPVNCQPPANPGVREIGWIDSGGGFSHIFAKPSYQDTLPAGSTATDAMRGVPDVAFQASSPPWCLPSPVTKRHSWGIRTGSPQDEARDGQPRTGGRSAAGGSATISGTLIRNRTPCRSGIASTVPPCMSAILRTIARPRPEPGSARAAADR
jgi:hypothetical protein